MKKNQNLHELTISENELSEQKFEKNALVFKKRTIAMFSNNHLGKILGGNPNGNGGNHSGGSPFCNGSE